MPSPAESTERLLAQAGWVRRLAHHLVRDPDRADDLVQDTWVAALRHPPRATDVAGTRSFLGRVLRNALRRRARGEHHRRQREAASARSEVDPRSAALVDEVDGQRVLLEEVLALAEPARTTILLRYFRGLSSAEIARREGLPPATVRSRLHRALAELRERLDARHGDRSTWSLAFLTWATAPTLGPPTLGPSSAAPAPLVPPLEGLVLMKLTKVAALLALTVLAAYGATRFERRVEPAAPEEAVAAPLRPATVFEPAPSIEVEETTPTVPDPVRRAAVSSTPDPRPVATRSAPAAEVLGPTTVTATFLDPDGLAVPGVELRCEGGPRDASPSTSLSNALGVAALRLELPPERHFADFSWRAEGFLMGGQSAGLEAGGTTDLGTITLENGTPVSGRVVDPSGRAVAAARVWAGAGAIPAGDRGQIERKGPGSVEGFGIERDTTPAVTSAADGTFRIPGVAPGGARLWAHAEGHRYCASEPFEVVAGRAVEGIEVVLEPLAPEDRIEGVVLTREGAALPGVPVRFAIHDDGFGLSSSVPTDGEGRFRIVVWRRIPHSLTVRGEGDQGVAHAARVEPGTLDVVLRLGDQDACELVVTDADGRPVETYEVTVCVGDEDSWTGRVEPESQHPGGRALIGLPEDRFWLEVRAVGFALGTLGPFALDRVPDRLDLVLERAPAIRGLVQAGGAPASNARVALYRAIDERTRLEVNGFPAFWQHTGESGRTDAEGRFVLMPRDPGRFVVRAELDGWAPGESSELRLGRNEGADDVDVRLGPGGTLVVTVVAPPGQDPAGVIVAVTRGDGHPRTLRTGPDGRATFEHLSPGRWDVRRTGEELSPDSTTSSSQTIGPGEAPPRPEWVVEVHEGRTSNHLLQLAESAPGSDG